MAVTTLYLAHERREKKTGEHFLILYEIVNICKEPRLICPDNPTAAISSIECAEHQERQEMVDFIFPGELSI
jgi:hypothetical protein